MLEGSRIWEAHELMPTTPKLLFPKRIATESFTDASADDLRCSVARRDAAHPHGSFSCAAAPRAALLRYGVRSFRAVPIARGDRLYDRTALSIICTGIAIDLT